MFGLRRETDRIPNFNKPTAKSNAFSNKLDGRFNVSGQSGSLTRHQEQKEAQRRYTAIDTLFNQRIELKISQDHAQLQNLEKQWELRREERILNSKSATLIQKVARGFLLRLKQRSADRITQTIQFAIAKRALLAARIALHVIKNFLINFIFQVRSRRRKFTKSIWNNIKGLYMYLEFISLHLAFTFS